MLFQILLYKAAFVVGSQCPIYTCGQSSTSGQCSIFSSTSGLNTYQVTPCIGGLICNFVNQNSSSCSNPPINSRNPGEICYSNSDCASNSCVSSLCAGKALGVTCKTSTDCNVGLYCNNNTKTNTLTCATQLKAGSSCTLSQQCQNNALCDDGVCTVLFTGSSSTKTPDTTTIIFNVGLAPICSSGFATNSSGVYTCAPAPVSNFTNVTSCVLGTNCVSKNGVSSKPCACGYDGNGYCPLFEGDSIVQNMISTMGTIITLSMKYCHTNNRFGYNCFAGTGSANFATYLNWAANAQLYWQNEWYLNISNPTCVKNSLNANYWNLYNQSKGISASTCPVYSCTNYTVGWNNSQCVYYNQDLYYNQLTKIVQLSPCNNNYTCSTTNSGLGNSSCIQPSTVSKYPGDYCTSNYQCQSGSCSNQACTGISLNQPCYNTFDCSPGLYCDGIGGVCVSAVPNGQCTYNYQCPTYYICIDSLCVKSFSFSVGLQVPSAPTGFNQACSSGFAYNNGISTYCNAALPTNSTSLYCTPGSLCYSLNGTYSKTCVCGFDGNGYCPAFEGDIYLQNAIKAYNQLSLSNQICSSYTGPTSNCYGNSVQNLLLYYYYYTNLTYYQNKPYLQNNQNCMQNIYNPSYWTAMAFIMNPSGPPSPPTPPNPHKSFSIVAGLSLFSLVLNNF